jgi:hypothetical protein
LELGRRLTPINSVRRLTLFKEHDIVMKKAFAVAVLAVCTLPAGAAAQNAADPTKMVQMFSVPLKLDGATMQVIILNDRTVEALFPQSQAKAALRTKGRMTTLLLVQGKATKDFEFDPTLKVEQKGKTLEGKASSMKNFTAGKVPKGESIQGMVELPEKVDLYAPFKVTLNGKTVEFRLNEDDVRDYGNR